MTGMIRSAESHLKQSLNHSDSQTCHTRSSSRT